MISTTSVLTIYLCSLERAFKTPLLCDVSKVHTGFGLMPKVTHISGDENWGQPGSTKKVYAAKSLIQKGGFASVDKVLERIENEYWKWQVCEFQSWMLGFSSFVGEWRTIEIEENIILVEYIYTLHSENNFLYPVNWLFTKLFWNRYMKRVVEKVRIMAYNYEPYQYE
ncbi:MAG: hypothetical protein ABI266_07930 [Ginsengibacter sp.]